MNPATTTDTTLSNFVTDTSAISSGKNYIYLIHIFFMISKKYITGTISNSQNHVTATDSSTTNFMTVVPLVSTGK